MAQDVDAYDMGSYSAPVRLQVTVPLVDPGEYSAIMIMIVIFIDNKVLHRVFISDFVSVAS